MYTQSTYKVKRHFFRHGRRIARKFCTHVRIETRLALSYKKLDPPHPIPIETRLYRAVGRPAAGRLQAVHCGQISYESLRILGKFCTHVQIDTLTLKKIKILTHPTGFRGLSNVKNLSRRTAPKFGTHVQIDTLTLKKKMWPTPPLGGLEGYLLLKIFRDGPCPNLARMCG